MRTQIDTKAQKSRLIRLMLANYKGTIVDAVDAVNRCRDTFGIDLDWHDYAAELDSMARCQLVTLIDGSGFCKYLIN